jgi:hypothetical protein
VIQRGENSRFTLESRNTLRIVAERFGKKLDGDTAAELRICGLEHLSL